MAMLQLGGTLFCATFRVNPRVSWWLTAQQLLSISSVAPPLAQNVKQQNKEEILPKASNNTEMSRLNKTIVSDVFKNLMENDDPASKKEAEMDSYALLKSRILIANNVHEVLKVIEHPDFKKENSTLVVTKLYKLVSDGVCQIQDFENDERYLSLLQYLKSKRQRHQKIGYLSHLDNISSMFGILHMDKILEQLNELNNKELLNVLSTLSYKKKRTVPLLESLCKKIASSKTELTIKQLADILFSLSSLNYPDTALMNKVCTDLVKVIPDNQTSSVIGSVVKSLGILRYKNEKLLDMLSEWITQNASSARPQDINSLLLTLAVVGYCPKNFDDLHQKVIHNLKETDMSDSSEWLNIVWSLTVLDKATPEHFSSVLNEVFQSRLFDLQIVSNVSREQKILNVNAAANYILEDYKGPVLNKNSHLFQISIPRSKSKHDLFKAAMSAFAVIIPKPSTYMNFNVNTGMGFILDAEFCVDEKCNPVPIDVKHDISLEIHRIAVMLCDYNDYCRDSESTLGIINLYSRLLESQGYKILYIPYSSISADAKLIDRVKYIYDKLRSILRKKSSSSIKI